MYLESGSMNILLQFTLSRPNQPKKVIIGPKSIFELRISTLKYPLNQVSFKAKHFEVLGPYLLERGVLRAKFRKLKSNGTFFGVNIKGFTNFWVTVTLSGPQYCFSKMLIKLFSVSNVEQNFIQHKFEATCSSQILGCPHNLFSFHPTGVQSYKKSLKQLEKQ